MDGSRFDALSRSLAANRSRRGLTRLLGGVAVAGPLGLLGLTETGAKKKKVTLCYQGQTKTVSKQAKKKYLKRGATLGACATVPLPPPGPPGPTCSDGIQNG